MLIRENADGGLFPAPPSNASPDYGELYIDDATGVVLTTPTSAADIKGSPMAAGNSQGVTLSATAGSVTIRRGGKYRLYAECGSITGVNSQALTLSFAKNATALASPAVVAKLTQPSTALAIVSLHAECVRSLQKGDVITFQATASTGDFTCKAGRFGVEQLNDGDQTA